MFAGVDQAQNYVTGVNDGEMLNSIQFKNKTENPHLVSFVYRVLESTFKENGVN